MEYKEKKNFINKFFVDFNLIKTKGIPGDFYMHFLALFLAILAIFGDFWKILLVSPKTAPDNSPEKTPEKTPSNFY